MPHIAPLASGWQRRLSNPAGPLSASASGASRGGVPFLLGNPAFPDARLIFEIAWGADLSGSPDAWPWTDISEDVLLGDGNRVSITLGAADEASATQPATCALGLHNWHGRYSLGPQSPNWPNVRQNVPVRVRVDLGVGPTALFAGFADSFQPRWDVTGRNAVVALKASGVLRRLLQGQSPVISSFRRNVTSAEMTSVVAYWPAEDGSDSTSIAAGIDGVQPMSFYLPGTYLPDFAASAVFACSDPLPRLANSAWFAPVPAYASTGQTQVRALISFPAGGSTDSSVLFRVHTTGTSDLWELRYKTGGVLSIRAWGAGVVLFEQNVAFAVDGDTGQYGIQLVQDGADVDWNIDALVLGAVSSVGFGGTLAGRTAGIVFKAEVNTDDAHPDVVLGHLTVQNATTSEVDQIVALNAHTGEIGPGRIIRLCAENGVRVNVIGNNIPGDGSTTACGFQGSETLVALLRECEIVDQGVLHDGLDAGFTYITRRRRENAAPFLTIDAIADLTDPPVPANDDQRIVNVAKATRKNASSAVYEDTGGPLGTAAIDVYGTSVTVNNDSDSEIAHYAAWLVHRGTVEGYRYPELVIDLAYAPNLISAWLSAILGGRIDVTSLDAALGSHPAGTVSLALEGHTQELDQYTWTVAANCSPYSPWQVGVWAADTGDTSPLVLRFGADGSGLVDPVSAGATTLTVSTPSGPLWTTLADDFPLEVDVGDNDLGVIRITVTSITGAGSPQTFTVDGATVTTQRPAGAPVAVVTPPLGL